MNDLAVKLTRLADRAVQKAQAENRAKGIANVYAINGRPVWQLPDGTLTEKSPF